MDKVKFIKYNGEKLPFRISYKAIAEWQKETKKSISDLDKIESDLSMLEPLLYHSLLVGHKHVQKEMTLKREDMQDVLDESWMDFVGGMGDFFLQTGVKGK